MSDDFYRETLNDLFPRHREIVRLELTDLPNMFDQKAFMEVLCNELAQSMQIPFEEESFQASLEAVAEQRLDLTRHRR